MKVTVRFVSFKNKLLSDLKSGRKLPMAAGYVHVVLGWIQDFEKSRHILSTGM